MPVPGRAVDEEKGGVGRVERMNPQGGGAEGGVAQDLEEPAIHEDPPAGQRHRIDRARVDEIDLHFEAFEIRMGGEAREDRPRGGG